MDLNSHDAYYRYFEEHAHLSFGRFTTPEIITSFARQKFLIQLSYEATACFDELKLIYQDFIKVHNTLTEKADTNWPSLHIALKYREGKCLYNALLKWAQYWNLNENWIIEDGFIAFNSWKNNPSLLQEPYWFDHPERFWGKKLQEAKDLVNRIENHPDFPMKPLEYSPFFDTRSPSEYLKEHDIFVKKIDQIYLEHGLVHSPFKKEDPTKHFIWLIQYQVLKMKPTEIVKLHLGQYIYARDAGKDKDLAPDSVKKAIRDTAKHVGLTLR